MFKHEDIWRAIDNLAALHKTTPSGLARLANLDATIFNYSKRIGKDGKKRWPNTESIAKILNASGTPVCDFFGLMQSSSHRGFTPQIPILPLAEAGHSENFDFYDQVIEQNWRFHEMPVLTSTSTAPACFALQVTDDSYAPVFQHGSILIISSSASLRRRDRVAVKMKEGQVLIRELKRQTAHRVDFKLVNDSEMEIFMMSEIKWISRIIMVQT